MKRYSIAQSCIPQQMNSRQGAVNPRAYNQENWSFNYRRDPGYQATKLDSVLQSDNMFTYKEGWQRIQSGMFDNSTKGKPIYGHIDNKRNPLEETEQTNLKAYDIQKQTRVSDSMNSAAVMYRVPYQYPWLRGLKQYQTGLAV